MKRIFLLAAFGIAGMMNANISITGVKAESKVYYHPITLTSSCGYTQVVEVGPKDQQECWMTDLQQMEDDCNSPFENPQYGYNP